MLQSYTLTYLVFDGSETDQVTLVINVTEANVMPPMFTGTVYNVSGPEEHDTDIAYPYFLTVVEATDQDNTNTITYSVAGVWASNFRINSTGAVSLIGPLDRDYPDGFDNWQVECEAQVASCVNIELKPLFC